jgi:type I restriction-modification system DNA methylase subunit
MTLNDIIDHVRNRAYMSGIDRDGLRVKATGEVFTPTPLVQEILSHLPEEAFADPFRTFIDPSCGDGQFLGEVLIRKVQELEANNVPVEQAFEIALRTIYGVDLMIDNVDLCRERWRTTCP